MQLKICNRQYKKSKFNTLNKIDRSNKNEQNMIFGGSWSETDEVIIIVSCKYTVVD